MHTEQMDTKWSNIYNGVLGCDKNQSVIVSTTESTTTSTTTTTTTVPSLSGTNYCTDVDPTRSYCWTVPSEYEEYDYYDHMTEYLHGDDRIDAGNTIKMSRKCNPDWHMAGTTNDKKMQTEHTFTVVNTGNMAATDMNLL